MTDYPKSIESIKKLIEEIESDNKKELRVIELEYAKVRDIYSQINTVAKTYFDQKIDTQRITVVKNDATNSLIIIGEPKNVQILHNLAKRLDVEDKVATQKMFIVNLKI